MRLVRLLPVSILWHPPPMRGSIDLVTLLVSGRLSDRFGRKLVITPGCLMAALSVVMLAFSNSYGFPRLSCAALGVGTGIVGHTPSANVADMTPREDHSTALSLYRTVSDLGFVTRPIAMR